MSECKSCTPSTLYMKIKMPNKFLPESVAMPFSLEYRYCSWTFLKSLRAVITMHSKSLEIFTYYIAKVFTWTEDIWSFHLLHAKIFHLSLISWVNMFLREDLDHVSKDNILQIIFTHFAVFVLLQVLQHHPISKLGANRWKLFRGGPCIAFQTDISWNDFHLFCSFNPVIQNRNCSIT